MENVFFFLITFFTGFMAAKKRGQDPSLGSREGQVVPLCQLPASSVFTDEMNRGGLTYPSEPFLAEVKTMEELFNSHHPIGNLRQKIGLIRNFTAKLVKAFPHRHPTTLDLFARTRTRIRMRTINRNAKMGKKSTLRGKVKTAQYSDSHSAAVQPNAHH
jgi:hypothetical protein